MNSIRCSSFRVSMAILFTCIAQAGALFSQAIVSQLPMTNGTVHTILFDDNTIYIGGSFSFVGPSIPYFTSANATTGALDAEMPAVDGYVHAIVPDGDGGWYVGGAFQYVGASARSNIVHILSNRTVDPDWNPGANDAVLTLVTSGSMVYAGGWFTEIGDSSRSYIASLDQSTGATSGWDPDADGDVLTIVISGPTVFVGGWFGNIGDSARSFVAALDSSTGKATGWKADAGAVVRSLAVGGSKLYAGGNFTTIGGTARNRIAALSISTGDVEGWNPNANGVVQKLALLNSVVYAGGNFYNIGGATRSFLAGIDSSSGLATGWDPMLLGENEEGGVYSLAVSASTVFAGGQFESCGDSVRNNIAELDASTGGATSWRANANAGVLAIAVSDTAVALGGSFTMIGGEVRNRLAAIDAVSGDIAGWNPTVLPWGDGTSYINILAASDSLVYAGGYFTAIGDSSRDWLAAIDKSTGIATAWNPHIDAVEDGVRDVVVSGSIVYVAGGDFTSAGDSARSYIAAIDATTGKATGWNPQLNDGAVALALSGSTVFAGGTFTQVGDSARNHIAAIDASTGIATSWDPNANLSVEELCASGSVVFAGGFFSDIGDSSRNRLAALDATTGRATRWNPNANGYVNNIAFSGSTVYVTGGFSAVGGTSRANLAALDTSAGTATSWDPNAVGGVHALALDFTNERVYAGGNFDNILGTARTYFAGVTNPDDVALPVQLFSLISNVTGCTVVLEWRTISEVNSFGFEVQRRRVIQQERRNGDPAWVAVGIVEGSGTGTSPREYSFIDRELQPGHYFYRLKQIDRDGTFTFSPETEAIVGFAPLVFGLAQNYPNPFNPSTEIQFTLAVDGWTTLRVFDLLGREVRRLKNEYLMAGEEYRVVFDASNLASGPYFLRLESAGTFLVRTMMLTR